MTKSVSFRSKAQIESDQNLAAFIEYAKDKLTVFGDDEFDWNATFVEAGEEECWPNGNHSNRGMGEARKLFSKLKSSKIGSRIQRLRKSKLTICCLRKPLSESQPKNASSSMP